MLIIFTLVIHTKTPAVQAEVVLQDVILPEYSGFEKSNLKVRPRENRNACTLRGRVCLRTLGVSEKLHGYRERKI